MWTPRGPSSVSRPRARSRSRRACCPPCSGGETTAEGGAKTYTPPIRASWWLRNPRYFLYMLRELTSLFIFLYVLAFVVQFFLLADRSAYEAFRALTTSPVFLAFTGAVWVMAVYHAITWWSLNARVFQIRLGGRNLPPAALFVGGILIWIVVSGLVYFLIFRGF
ncbi:MAG: hypothetical protein ACE5LS_05440 [Thermoplasmata archaeon]